MRMASKRKSAFGYKFARVILGPTFKLYYNPKIYGKENIPKKGPILICGNHIHIMDQCGPIIATKRVLVYMAKKEYFDGKFAWFFRWVGSIPVDRSTKDEAAKNRALEVLNNNGAIGIFPEGTRNKTKANLLPFKFGAVSLAKKSKALIIPVAVTGTYKFRSKDLVFNFGKPIDISKLDLEEANKLLYKEIETLMKKREDS